MSSTALPSLPGHVVDQAIEWSIRLTYNQADAATHAAFDAWLNGDDSHRLAWQRIQLLRGRFAGASTGLIQQAMEKLPEARLQRRKMLKLLALFAAVGGSTWAARETTPWQRVLADFSTRVGERGQWTLADGSLLDLNTDSAVRLDFDAQHRSIELLRGELHLVSGADTASATPRPLRVSTAFGAFESLDARFSLRLDGQACRLGVTVGAVRLQPLAGSASLAQAGETWRLTATGGQREPGNAVDAAAWRDGLLVARDMPLAQLLEELRRYRNGHLGCDPEIAQRRINGNFNLADTDATLAFLAQAHGLRLHSLTRYWIRLSA